jgi:uncharacterized protein (DUF1501 family)
MLDPDISTFDALAHLSTPESPPSRSGIDRRRFLQLAALTGGGAAFGSIVPAGVRDAFAGRPIQANDGVLVVVLLGGGNDGLNTFVPYTDGAYYDQRQGLAIPASDVLALDGKIGLHPNLPYVKSLWDQGRVAIVEGLGYQNPDLSHFSSMAKWMSAYPVGQPSSGWLGRWLDDRKTPVDSFDMVSLSTSVPLHVVGRTRRATGIAASDYAFGVSQEPHELRLATAVESFSRTLSGVGQWGDAVSLISRQMINVNREVSKRLTPPLPEGNLVRELTLAARLINANIGVRVVTTTLGDFDTHANQGFAHPQQLTTLNNALKSFYETLSPTFANRVTLMTFAEFGRRLPGNQSGGTDHGTSNSHMVIGPKVRGGFHGQRPSLTDLDSEGCPKFTVDFRSYYATMLDRWLGGDSNATLGGTFAPLNLFTAGPGL